MQSQFFQIMPINIFPVITQLSSHQRSLEYVAALLMRLYGPYMPDVVGLQAAMTSMCWPKQLEHCVDQQTFMLRR